MHEYIFLEKSPYNHYYPMKNNNTSNLCDLNDYFSGDHRYYNDDLFTKDQSHFNNTVIVNDFKNKDLYIVIQDHDIENHIPDDDRARLTNEFNSCKISYDNFVEFKQKWLSIKKILFPFAIIYRDNNNWINCQGFNSQDEMEQFAKDNQSKALH